MAREIWPYFRAGSGSVVFSPWHYSSTDEVVPEYIEGWDPQTDISLTRTVQCDSEAIRTDTGLDADVPLILAVSWLNHQSDMTEALYRAPLDSRNEVQVVLPAARLGGSITLRTVVVVGATDAARPIGRAKWAGSILISDEQRLVLEGDGPMFPIAEIDFASTAFAPEASWALQIPDDLSFPVLGSVLLLVNTRDRELVAALGSSRPDPRQTTLLQTLEGQIGAFLIAQATERAESVREEEWAEQSVGDLLARYLAIAERHGVPMIAVSGDASALAVSYEGAARAAGFGRRFA